MTMRLQWRLMAPAFCLSLVVLGGCATSKSQPAILSLPSVVSCQAAPDLTAAVPLGFNPEKEEAVTVTIDAGSHCLEPSPGARSLYSILALPQAGQPFVVLVASAPQGESIFAPRLILLDAKGAISRQVPAEDFMFRGSALSALIRVHENERYLVVASDPQTVGQRTESVQGSTSTQMMPMAGGYFWASSGRETKSDLTYSHGGTVKVAARALTSRR